MDEELVTMDNDETYKVIKIGNDHIKMYDGMMRTLVDVRHVSNLKRNLISLGILDMKKKDAGVVVKVEG